MRLSGASENCPLAQRGAFPNLPLLLVYLLTLNYYVVIGR